MFTTFKTELDKLTKEKAALTKQCKAYEIQTIKSLTVMEDLKSERKKNEKLKILCRTLQERAKAQNLEVAQGKEGTDDA